MTHVWKSQDNFWGVLSFHHMGPRDGRKPGNLAFLLLFLLNGLQYDFLVNYKCSLLVVSSACFEQVKEKISCTVSMR